MRQFGPTGTPQVTLTESVMTWLELASMLYEMNIFDNDVGFASIEELSKNNSNCVTDKVVGAYSNATNMVENARIEAEKLKQNMDQVDTSHMPQATLVLSGQFNPGETLSQGPDLDGKSKEELIDLVRACNVRIGQLEYTLADKDAIITEYNKNNIELKTQLDAAKANNAGFMAAADKSNLEKKMLSDTFAAEVLKDLKPFLSKQLESVTQSLQPVLDLVAPLKGVATKVDGVDTNLTKLAVDMLNTVAETNQEATLESFVEVRGILAGVGITAGPGKTNVPEALSSIALILKDGKSADGVSVKVHSGQCTYKALDSQPDRFLCTLGCGSELMMGSTGMPASSSPASQMTPRTPYNPPFSSSGQSASSVPAAQQTLGSSYLPPTPGFSPQQQYQQPMNSQRFPSPSNQISKTMKRKIAYDSRVISKFQNQLMNRPYFPEVSVPPPGHPHYGAQQQNPYQGQAQQQQQPQYQPPQLHQQPQIQYQQHPGPGNGVVNLPPTGMVLEPVVLMAMLNIL